MTTDREAAIAALYHQVLQGWNARDGAAFAAGFAPDGVVIGFDGSEHQGRERIADEMNRIFKDHATGAYIGKVRGVRLVGEAALVLRAVAGLVPAGQNDLNPQLNAVQVLVAELAEGDWRIVHLQNTPAQYHGRPQAVQALTDELRQVLRGAPA